MIKIKKILKNICINLKYLKKPKLNSEIILSNIINRSINWIRIFNENKININYIKKKINKIIKRRINGEPIEYLLKKCEFWSLIINIIPITIIPRQDTEIIIEIALKKINNNDTILDLGSGSGIISLSLANENKNIKIVGVDNIYKVIKLANKNAINLKLKNILFINSNWFSILKKKKFNIIISNPPYISIYDLNLNNLSLKFEPINSILSKNNGLNEIEYIINKSRLYLNLNGWLLIEHGFNQKIKTKYLFKKYNFSNINSYKDYNKKYRVTIGQLI
ncbi:peptide chain release factor N(5)-glutamine methyltransferase [Candidatus Annandia pinicola]|uniref:peptide chain release factor N(5)-glutamine methyltransferase n=1 Tax=Candidatus Annandia pinicola TaxID=1345117 RepID=UPI001D01C98E|nr:peptide chain release factor N(5)-glutamine methyltransferase [Candidatus Annandia pinicola]UDG80355.1 Release factor glutamine methyltransferase [Candidatus Annandia pinicola]